MWLMFLLYLQSSRSVSRNKKRRRAKKPRAPLLERPSSTLCSLLESVKSCYVGVAWL